MRQLLSLFCVLCVATPCLASDGAASHSDPAAPVIFWTAVVLGLAVVGGYAIRKLGLPGVLGELTIGILFSIVLVNALSSDFVSILREGPPLIEAWDHGAHGGNLKETLAARYPEGEAERLMKILSSPDAGVQINTARALHLWGSIGVILLLLAAGLESNLREMIRVGPSSLVVAVIGVICPFILGWLTVLVLVPDSSWYVHMFAGAALTATSVGITARVLKDLNKHKTDEAKIVLGAAVIDDVLGLIILAVVAGIITAAGHPGGNEGHGSILLQLTIISAKAIGFLGGAILFGLTIHPWLSRMVQRLDMPSTKVLYVVGFGFVMAFIANLVGLAPIVGAFAAGLVLEEVHFRGYLRSNGHDGHDERAEEHQLEELIRPICALFVPVFFVLMGIQVKMEVFLNPSTLILGLALTVVAVLGKQACALGVLQRGTDRVAVGLGMIPRGEVGLIFAAIGKGLMMNGTPVVSDQLFSAIVVMVVLTTLVTPFALQWRLKKTT